MVQNASGIMVDPDYVRKTMKESFTLCYLVLFGTAAITFIEALRTNSVHARHILNLETAVSLTAGFVYGMFLTMVDKPNFSLRECVYYRYIDWSITTPMLLLVLLLFFTFHSKEPLSIAAYGIVVMLNYFMLYFGYMGEKGIMPKRQAQILGFASFALMLAFIYVYFVHDKVTSLTCPPFILFVIFTIVWSAYGVAAEMDDLTKNKMYNVLDIIAKVFFGLGLWMYYGGVTSI